MKKIMPILLVIFLMATSDLVFAQNGNTLKVMTYNILHGAPPGLKHTNHKIDLSAVAKVIKAEDPDIVALQEVDSMWSRSDNQFQPKVLSELTGMKYYYYSDSRSFTDTAGWGYGIAILSKYKIKDEESLYLPYHYHPGSENWVNSIVTVAFPNGKDVKFICAHFDYLYEDNRILEAHATNTTARTSDIPVILAGDLNSRPGSQPIEILKQAYISSCDECELTFSSDRPRFKLDWIMYSKESPFEVVSEKVIDNEDTKFASDHFPYVVELKWKE